MMVKAKVNRAILAAAVCAVVAAGLPAGADDSPARVWLISTRRAPRCGRVEQGVQQIDYRRLQADRRWLTLDEESFLGDVDRALPTTVFVHGNDTGRRAATDDGWRLLQRMKQDAAGPPFRFVVWSWPSDRLHTRRRPDAQAKASGSDVQSYYLARCLERMGHADPKAEVSLVGYSFGARVIAGALHMLGGGEVAGRKLPGPIDAKSTPIHRAVLVAAAMDADWLFEGHRNGLALAQVRRMLVTQNRCDRALKWYPLLYRRGGPHALGHVGPAGCGRLDNVELLDVTCSVGRTHNWARYLAAPGLRRRLASYTFLQPAVMQVTGGGEE